MTPFQHKLVTSEIRQHLALILAAGVTLIIATAACGLAIPRQADDRITASGAAGSLEATSIALRATATALAQGRAALNPRTEPPALNSLRPRRSADSTIALSFEDLPDGFTPVFVDVPGMLIGSDSFPDAQLSGVFAFEHSNGLEFVEGFVVRFKHLAECEAFDEDLNDNHRLDLLIQEWKTSLDIVKVESISGATAGDNSTFMSMLVQEDRRRGELEVALFRRRRFGSFIAVFHPSTVRPHASIEDLARKLDDTICSQMAGCDNIGPAPACTDLPTSRGEQSLTATS